MINQLIHRHIQEIQGSRALRIYGACLGLTHFFTLVWWNFGSTLTRHLADPIIYCWPFLPQCEPYRNFVSAMFTPLFIAYCLTSLLSVVLWFIPRLTAGAYPSLFLATALKGVFYLIDYREMGNYHYMPYLVLIVFLLMPHKMVTLRYLVTAFYLGAGLLKFNREWLSGSAIYGAPLLQGAWLSLSCFAALFLEMIGSLGLLSRRLSLFIPALFAFIGFHLFSWHLVGFFYPCVMFCLLAILPLSHLESQAQRLDIEDLLGFKAPRSAYLVLGVFILMQLPPLVSSSDSALTGEGRLVSLNMFDAQIYCHSHIYIRRLQNGVPSLIDITHATQDLGPRIRCEPWVFRSYAQSLCRLNRTDPDFLNIDLELAGRRSSDSTFTVLLSEKDVCSLH